MTITTSSKNELVVNNGDPQFEQKDRVRVEPWSCAASSYFFMDEEPERMLICWVEISVEILWGVGERERERARERGGVRILGKMNLP